MFLSGGPNISKNKKKGPRLVLICVEALIKCEYFLVNTGSDMPNKKLSLVRKLHL